MTMTFTLLSFLGVFIKKNVNPAIIIKKLTLYSNIRLFTLSNSRNSEKNTGFPCEHIDKA